MNGVWGNFGAGSVCEALGVAECRCRKAEGRTAPAGRLSIRATSVTTSGSKAIDLQWSG